MIASAFGPSTRISLIDKRIVTVSDRRKNKESTGQATFGKRSIGPRYLKFLHSAVWLPGSLRSRRAIMPVSVLREDELQRLRMNANLNGQGAKHLPINLNRDVGITLHPHPAAISTLTPELAVPFHGDVKGPHGRPIAERRSLGRIFSGHQGALYP